MKLSELVAYLQSCLEECRADDEMPDDPEVYIQQCTTTKAHQAYLNTDIEPPAVYIID